MIRNNIFNFEPNKIPASDKKKSLVIYLIIILLSINIFLAINLFNKFNFFSSSSDEQIKLSSAKIPQVELLNGCGISDLSDKLTNYLRKNKIDVIQAGNYYTFDVEESLVIDRKGKIETAKNIAEALGIKNENVVQIINKNLMLDATIIIGKDFNQLNLFNKEKL